MSSPTSKPWMDHDGQQRHSSSRTYQATQPTNAPNPNTNPKDMEVWSRLVDRSYGFGVGVGVGGHLPFILVA